MLRKVLVPSADPNTRIEWVIADEDDVADEPAQSGRRMPPVEYQFKPGQSGNPKGRPKGASVRDIVQRLANQAIADDCAKRRKFDPRTSKLEAALAIVFARAEDGDGRATRTVIELARRYQPKIGANVTGDEAPLSDGAEEG